jgi:hypothetical protein
MYQLRNKRKVVLLSEILIDGDNSDVCTIIELN